MADPRDIVDFEGIGADYVTVEHDGTIVYDRDEEGGSAQVGLAVTVNDDDTISLVGDGERVFGKLITVEPDGKATVQYRGGMTLPGGDGATLTVGQPIVGDLNASAAEGYIRMAASATAAEAMNARGTIMNNNTTTAVKVIL